MKREIYQLVLSKQKWLLLSLAWGIVLYLPGPASALSKRTELVLPAVPQLVHDHPQKMIIGIVSGSEGPIAGVSVTIVGSPEKGVITNEKGEYSISAQASDSLKFSYVGMSPQTVLVGDKTVINVALLVDESSLEEVTVVAFGTQKKESVVSAITSVSPKDLRVPSSNLTVALAGQIAGLIAYQRSGEPGLDNADFFIRGVTSFGYATSPLILIDNLEMTAEDLARMQPDDIASFSILKDASATSLYGARGANGVIMVTTKEGKEGKAQISVRYEKSVSSPTQQIQIADPITYMKLHNEAVLTRDPLGQLPYSYEKIENTELGTNPLVYPATDWHNMLFKRQAVNDRVNLNISGGGKVARYYVAGTFNQDNGVLKVDPRNNFNSNIDLKKYLLRSNIHINITSTTEAVTRLHATFDDYTGPIDGGADLFNKVMRTNPVLFPAYYPADEDRRLVQHTLFGNFDDGNYLNPYADLMRGYKDYSTSNMMAQFEINQDLRFFTQGLRMTGMFSTSRYSSFDVQRFYTPFLYSLASYDKATGAHVLSPINPEDGTEHLDYLEGAKLVSSNTYLQTTLNYERGFGDDHNVGGLLVFYMRNELIGNAGSLQNSLAFRNMGLSGRGTYGYKGRYFLEANFGYNGSERFSEKNRFGFFPSVGGAWVVSNEPFWKSGIADLIPTLKLRATVGLVGNDAIGSAAERFFHLSQVNMNDASKAFTFGSEFQYTKNGISVTRYENEDITWETARKTNLGMEMKISGFMNLNIDVYKEHRRNILMTRAHVPNTLGLLSMPMANVGEARGKGIDVAVDVQKNFPSSWWIIGRANMTYATSEFLVYEEPDFSQTPWKSRIGYPLSQTWGYVAERLFVDENEVRNSPQQAPGTMAGDIKYKDINGDGVVDELDQVAIGFPTTPEIIYGFGFSTGYKAFDLSCFFQGLSRESFWVNPSSTAPFAGQTALLKVYEESHWSEGNRDLYALWPRLSANTNANNTAVSTWFMQNGAFLRLKTVELGGTLPGHLTQRAGIARARLYVSGMNLLTMSAFKLWDPEMAGNGLGYPIQKVYNFGIQVTF